MKVTFESKCATLTETDKALMDSRQAIRNAMKAGAQMACALDGLADGGSYSTEDLRSLAREWWSVADPESAGE